ncbi:MAG TPA: hypothetical protein VN787_05400 [Steroidobacteraceae bacterium]|nr:hypothetical protein [Steroidobacteraceae bacterium]
MNTAVQSVPAASAPPALRVSKAMLGLIASTLVLVVGWLVPLDRYLTPRSGIGYWLGIIGGSLMLALLIYPARKRIPSLAPIGTPRTWFKIHMVLGVVGPLCILYHSGYHLGAANSNVALFSMLIVAGSGLVGRYLYTRIHHGLYGRKTSLEELRADAENLKSEASGAARLLPELAARIDAGEQRIANGILLLPQPLAAAILWRWQRHELRHYVHQALRGAAAGSTTIARHRPGLAAAATRYSDARLTAARRVAEFRSCERLFSLWHVLHLPLFGMLFVAGVVHVVAVNVY